MFRSIKSEIANTEPYIFTPLDVKWTRNTDSEFRMLNKLALSLEPNAKITDQFLHYEGTLKIISENAYCTSCQGIVVQFNKMFPKINIVLIDATKI
ncbi:deaminase domain-containing protein [Flavobacterium hibernum]|nr:deaminase domain-containing protein [Flavobacterium hibernum]